jgi:4-hydroxy-3-methylbut-2-enyl diphosphate reductase IspH
VSGGTQPWEKCSGMPEVPRGRTHAVIHAGEDEAAAFGLPVLDATCPLVSQVHNQGERYVQQGRSIAVTGQAGAKSGLNSNRLRETGAEAKIPAFLIADQTELGIRRGSCSGATRAT